MSKHQNLNGYINSIIVWHVILLDFLIFFFSFSAIILIPFLTAGYKPYTINTKACMRLTLSTTPQSNKFLIEQSYQSIYISDFYHLGLRRKAKQGWTGIACKTKLPAWEAPSLIRSSYLLHLSFSFLIYYYQNLVAFLYFSLYYVNIKIKSTFFFPFLSLFISWKLSQWE